jgi:plasmid stabilization system protein ParE
MTYEILITPTALLDISEAIEYYNTKANNLGYKFADDLENNLRQIALMPKAYSIRYKNVRGKLLKKFPFLILYTESKESNSIEVLRIFNTYQNQYWKE